MSNKQKLEKAIKLVEEGNIPDYFEFMKSEVGENTTLSLLQNTVIEGKESVGFHQRLILLARTFFDEKATKERKTLLEGLAKRYEKRLEKKLEENVFQNIEVGLEYTTEGTSEKHVATYFIEKKEMPTGDFQDLFERYKTELKSLLVLGEAGSGKTVLLLRIGKKLVELAKKDVFYPLPVLVNLASWRNEEKDFKTWLASVLVFSAGESGISKDYAKDLVEENNLLLLLDGLDEIPADHRNSCLEAFKQYAIEIDNNRTDYPKWVICSRKNAYKQAEKDAFVQASVLFKPLTDEKIQTTLCALAKDKNMAAQALMEKITANPTITAHFRTAFEFHLALKMANEDNFRATHLVEDFIDKEFKTITPEYPKAKQYLSFLAKKMKGINFELVDMQPDWLLYKRKYIIIIILLHTFIAFAGINFFYDKYINIYSFIFIFLSISLFYLLRGSAFGLMGGFIGGIFGLVLDTVLVSKEEKQKYILAKIFGVIGYFIAFFYNLAYMNNISIKGRRIFSIRKKQLLSHFFYVFLYGFLYVFITVFWVIDIIIGFKVGLIWGLVLGIIEIIFIEQKFAKTNYPYFNLYVQLPIDFFQWLFISLSISLLVQDKTYFYFFAINVLFSAMLTIFLSPLLQHFILRFLLWQEGKIPLRWVSLLNKLDKKTGIMEKDGGQWRFRHQLLQDALGK